MLSFDEVLIGGAWQKAARGTYPVVDPATEEIVGAAPSASPEQAQDAARAAKQALGSEEWSGLLPRQRGELLREAAARFRAESNRLVDLTISETGAVRPVAISQQVGAVAARLEKYADLASELGDEALPPRLPIGQGGGVTSGIVVREPVGVVACITPFNFPMTNCAGKVGPALACGNTVVVKPAPVDPLGVASLCRIIAPIFPPGVINIVCGPGADIGEALSTSADVDMISFTGSTTVGCSIQKAAGAQMKRSLMELGGKSASIIFADADPKRALAGVMQAWTFHSGQICIAGTRALIEESIYEKFTGELVRAAKALRIGDPREEGVTVGPLVSAQQRDRVEMHIARAISEGATLACGGRRPPHLSKGYFIEPTLFTDATNQMRVAREEIFGPVITAIPFRKEEDAIRIANDSDFGLYGYVWSQDVGRAIRVARRLRTGTVQINGAAMNPDAPFGGYKLSGVGRDGGRYALQTYSELKYIGWVTS